MCPNEPGQRLSGIRGAWSTQCWTDYTWDWRQTDTQAGRYAGRETHPATPSYWCFPASRLYTAFSGLCPVGPTHLGWNLWSHLQWWLIPTTPHTFQCRQWNSNKPAIMWPEVTALRQRRSSIRGQKKLSRATVCVRSAQAWTWVQRPTLRNTYSGLLTAISQTVSHDVWCGRMCSISNKYGLLHRLFSNWNVH